MAIKYASSIDLNKLELQNARIQNLAAAPASPVEGQIYHNTVDHFLYEYSGSVWNKLYYVHPNHSGDVTSVGDGAQTIAADVVTNAKLANMATGTIKGNNSGSTGDPLDLTTAQTKTMLAIVHTDLSDFDAGVRANRLDQMAAAAGIVDLNGNRITYVLDPVDPMDAANKQYVDALAQGLDAHASVKAATTTNITLGSCPATLDGISLASGDRVLVKDQTSPAQNGVYVYTSGVLTRSTDCATGASLVSAYVWVERGTTFGDTGWVCTSDSIVIEMDAVTWAQFAGAGAIVAGNGLTRTGNTIDVNVDNLSIGISADILFVRAGGITDAHVATANKDGVVSTASMRTIGAGAQQAAAGNHTHTTGLLTAAGFSANTNTLIGRSSAGTGPLEEISVTAQGRALIDDADVATMQTTLGISTFIKTLIDDASAALARATLGAVGKYSALCTTATSQTIAAATHGLGVGQDKVVQIYTVASTYDKVETDVQINPTTGDVTVIFATAPTAGQYRIVITG